MLTSDELDEGQHMLRAWQAVTSKPLTSREIKFAKTLTAPLQARIAELEQVVAQSVSDIGQLQEMGEDAARYQAVLMRISGHRDHNGEFFNLRGPRPVTKNITKGSAAQHFTAAIDAARSAK